jgi:cell division cycle 14
MGAFCIIVLKRSALQVTEMFSNVPVRFRDASEGTCHFFLSLSDCFQGLEHAIRRNWFNYLTFDSPFYEHYSKPSNGDLNWLIPGQFLAFSSPKSDSEPLSRNSKLPASKYSEILSKLSIKTVIRLNKAKYEPSHFTNSKISHYDLHFKDGSVPCLELVDRFIDICSSNQGAVGVHCKAGLGRTGTLIGCYSIKIFKFPASAFIAWCRLCRPGSVLGPQQQFLIDYEDSVKNKKKFCLSTVGIDSTKAVLGDQNQGLRLLQAKKRRSESISEVSSVDINTPVKDEDFKVEKKENEKSCQKDGFKTPEKRCRFGYEIGKLCAKRYNGKYRNAFFYESAGKNLKTNRIYKILYGANDEDIN